ncbi:major facilitator superfamily domain-containing protein [Mariannaea sp. PMI_226]|nr:major facilitator superfamily domain-containing protein [Mariannaea sp. PMI_226]
MLQSIFGSTSSTPLPRPTSQYQPLPEDDDGGEDYPDVHTPLRSASPLKSSKAVDNSYGDAAAEMLIKLGRDPDAHIVISPADDARILRRIDLALLPIMLSVYFLQALDKATLSYASVFGIIDDTGLKGDQFSWLGSIVFLAIMVMQPPLALALVKLPIGKLTSFMVMGWGLTLVAMTWAHNFRMLMIARFLLGAFEASIGPSFVAITQMWWRRREQTIRMGSWYCMNGMTWVFGSLITYGLASINSPLKPYQIIFLFFGSVTVAVAVVIFFWMPDSPTEAKFLSDEDKVIAIQRLRDNQMGIMSREWRSAHVYETLTDPKTWFWVAMIFCISVPSNGISLFGSLILDSFVSNPYHTMLFNVPVGLSHITAVIGSAWLAMKWKLKGPVIALMCIPPIIGCSILLHFPHDKENWAILLTGYFCLSTFAGITPLIFSWSAHNTAGDTKKKSTSALIFISSSAGNILGPLLYSPDEAPGYSRGLAANLIFYILIIFLVVGTSIYLHRLNQQHSHRRLALGKNPVLVDMSLETAEEIERIGGTARSNQGGIMRDRSNGDNGTFSGSSTVEAHGEAGTQADKAFMDLTDLENEDFLYVF